MEKVSAIVIHEHGDPATVARCEQFEIPPVAPGEVRVHVAFAPINPADINVLEGKYPVRPSLPGVPGIEGAGVLEDGTHVLLPHGFGTWREAGNVRESALVHVPGNIPLEQAAMLRINPATALCLLREFTTPAPGGWVIQNAANSAVGRCVIQIAKHLGLRTVNVVRRAELVPELTAIGADAVIVASETLTSDILAVIGKDRASLALNAVGGDSATRIAGALAPGGSIVTYGAMARQPLRIPNGLLIFGDIVWRGFWITRWYERATAARRAALFAELFDLSERGIVTTPVEATYALEDIAAALAHAQRARRTGKVLLRCSG